MTPAEVEQIEAARVSAKVYCADPTVTASDPTAVAQLRALVPTISAALGKKE